MKELNNFDVLVPEMGDDAIIVQVSNAIEDVEDALAGTVEFLDATIDGDTIILTSKVRTTERIRYYEGLTVQFIMPSDIEPNKINKMGIDGLNIQPAIFSFEVSAGETIMANYTDKGYFVANYFTVPKSNAIDSDNTTIVATSRAVKITYDRADESYHYRGDLPNLDIDKSYTITEIFSLEEGYYNVIDDDTNFGMTKLNLDPNIVFHNGTLFVKSSQANIRTYKYVPIVFDSEDSYQKKTIAHISIPYNGSVGAMSERSWVYNMSREEINKLIKDNKDEIKNNTSNIIDDKNKIDNNEDNININKNNISSNTGKINTNTSNILTNKTNISSNLGKINSNTGSISSNLGKINSNTSNISKNTGLINTNKSNISSNTNKTTSNKKEIDAMKGRSDVLWTGRHYMDSKEPLIVNNSFDNYQIIMMYVTDEPADSASGANSSQLICPTAIYGYPSYCFADLYDQDWCGAYLKNNNTIVPNASHEVWISNVVGIR